MTRAILTTQWRAILVLYGATFIAAALGSVGSASAGDFYQQLNLPAFAPPGWVFGPAWTFLYIAMATAAFLVWRSQAEVRTRPVLALFLIHLAVNSLWSWLFFAWRTGLGATIGVIILLILVVWLARRFRYFSRVAMWLMVPYALWVAFATVLTISVWRLNPGML